MKLFKLATLLLCTVSFGCGTTRSIKLISSPPSDVFVSSEFSEGYKKIGTTPIDVNLKEISGSEKFAYLSFEIEGYKGHRVILPSRYSQGSIEIELEKLQDIEEIKERLKENMSTQLDNWREQMRQQRANYIANIESERRRHKEEKAELESEFKENSLKIFNKVIEVQNALHLKKMAKAAKALAELRTYPAPESLLLTLEGNFEFINGRVKRALASYQRALTIDPTNSELEGVLKELRRIGMK